MKKWLFTLFLLIIASSSFAGTALNCSQVDSMKDNEVDFCVQQTDEWLNSTYQQAMNLYQDNHPVKNALRSAQRAWIKFRDTECAFHLARSVSTNKERVLNSCIAKMTFVREQELAELVLKH